MSSSLENLRELAARLRRGDPLAFDQMQTALQPGLVHVLRRALRCGGESAVARWLGRTLGVSPDGNAAGSDPHELASVLCKEIACQLQSGTARSAGAVPDRATAETVVETAKSGRP
jgi:hypothetical protein